MTRTKKGSKGPGYDYWGKRGWADKDITKGRERTKERDQINEIKKDAYLGTPDTEREDERAKEVNNKVDLYTLMNSPAYCHYCGDNTESYEWECRVCGMSKPLSAFGR